MPIASYTQGRGSDLALMQLIDAGGYFRIPRPIPTAGYGESIHTNANDSSEKIMVCRYIKI